MPLADTQSNSTFYDVAEVKSQYSPSTISRRRHRRHLSSESTFLLSSRDCSPIRRRSPATISSHSMYTQNDEKKANHEIEKLRHFSQQKQKQQQKNAATLKEKKQEQQITHFDCDESYFQSSPNSSLSIQCATPTRSYLRSSLPVRRSMAKLQDTPSPSLSPSPTPSRFNRAFSSCGSSTDDNQRRSWRQCKTLPNSSNNSSSITLQVTATTNSEKMEPNTKIYVQNTPSHNMITFENDKLLNESNVYLINNESITNKHGELLRKTISTQNYKPQQQQREALTYWQQQHEHKPIPKPKLQINNFNKNNNTILNNNRRLSMPQTITSATGVHYGSTQLIYKNNVLKQHEEPTEEEQPLDDWKISDLVVGNLGFYEKNNYQMLSNNTLCETKNLRNSNNNNNNKHMMESEPNLMTFKDNNSLSEKSLLKKSQQHNKQYFGKENGLNSVEALTTLNDEIRCSFPTLTDISFNFTSLAAQKILQAVSLNSIDTLVELNVEAAKLAAVHNKQLQQQRKDEANEITTSTTNGHTSTTTTATTKSAASALV